MISPNRTVRIELSSGRGQTGDDNSGTVHLRVYDDASSTVLVDAEIPPATWWWLLQGGSHTTAGFVSDHLDRVGKRMESQRVDLPDALDGDTDDDVRRDVWKAVHAQLPEHWHDWGGAYDAPRIQGGGSRQRYTIVRRWVAEA